MTTELPGESLFKNTEPYERPYQYINSEKEKEKIIIVDITYEECLVIWKTKLWANRKSPIESHSAMAYMSERIDMKNFDLPVWFYGLYDIGPRSILHTPVGPAMFAKHIPQLVGVNSGHMCSDGSARSRGLWVNPDYKGKAYGKELLLTTIERARFEEATLIWSYPRKTSWSSYSKAGFRLASTWKASETSEANAYCFLNLR